ncbi:TerD family protein [Streptomyces kanasensis]|uniref:TerD family protein n=1 Tax=Streptomyces kanasensis TaxID=936756 RepID=UPI0036F75A49
MRGHGGGEGSDEAVLLVGAEDKVGAGFQEGGHLLTWSVVEQIGGGGRTGRRHEAQVRRWGIALAKAGNVSLLQSRTQPHTGEGRARLRCPLYHRSPFDLDASVLLCNSGQVLEGEWLVFYNQLTSPEVRWSTPETTSPVRATVTASGSWLTFSKVPAEVEKRLPNHETDNRGQTFGQVSMRSSA